MYITDLEQMEEIVESRDDLIWDGWNVVKLSKKPSAIYSKSGLFRNGEWFEGKVFTPTEKGYDIPAYLGRLNAQVAG